MEKLYGGKKRQLLDNRNAKNELFIFFVLFCFVVFFFFVDSVFISRNIKSPTFSLSFSSINNITFHHHIKVYGIYTDIKLLYACVKNKYFLFTCLSISNKIIRLILRIMWYFQCVSIFTSLFNIPSIFDADKIRTCKLY